MLGEEGTKGVEAGPYHLIVLNATVQLSRTRGYDGTVKLSQVM